MLRIINSLPRTHKLLLLPAITVVTVLGAHTVLSNPDSPNKTIISDVQPITLVEADTGRPFNAVNATPQVRAELALSIPATPPTEPAIDTNALELARLLSQPLAQDSPQIAESSYSEPVDLADDGNDSTLLDSELVANEQYVPEWQSYTIQPGDSFAVMAERSLGLGYSDVLKLLSVLPDKKVLTRLQVGHDLYYKLDQEGDLIALKVMTDARKGYLLERHDADQSFEISNIKQATQSTQRLFAGTVEGSFGASALSTGLSSGEVAELSQALGKKVDFRRDTRQGDRFQVLVESDMIDGRPLASRILAAHYEGKKTDLSIVRHDEAFYTPDGKSLDPSFERYPFSGHQRMSSPFNLRRHHPVTGRISPHYGTDFAMKVGTPVRSTGAGRVTRVVRHPLAGLYVVITHDNGYKTRYLHLSRTLVKVGQRVKLDQKIALSGNSGRTTGPHLHYEVIVNNHRVNPMRFKLPGGVNLKGQELAAFKKRTNSLLAKLDNADNSRAVARTRSGSDDSES
ncbi:peptidoglycan DD-metalloendopeptidase family protein [Larsenimonas rhizosphaerae]|uniref:Peptidoglycan DD-metalloendopeptidase family protein n=1 Tax=Larsenimonas rhizosphaerae TaxID=2944682 RepID=A0AA41ZF28_9GAMM|nr:peptidoglycan DD-metalloendopeptidase family protein [Larsenimonas rhizosphaerae]MCX2522989.1 peptidoglycan DD-metalloendopeptidase family protein [Larsenimonas rhizosphaerae]